ncbi:MAG: hypothetical protein AAF401_05860 [Pseudomonadota bacterium]
MAVFRYKLRTDWLFYILLVSYALTLGNMTVQLWFGGGINIFANYSDAASSATAIADANKVYWSKSCFLFSALLLIGLNVEIRAAFGVAAVFWSSSLLLVFGPTPPLIFTFLLGLALIGLQVRRRELFCPKSTSLRHSPVQS